MQDARENLGRVIRSFRQQMDHTQDSLAERLDIQSRTVLEIENGRGNPQFDILYSMIRLLHIPADDIFYFDRKPLSDESAQFFRKLSAFSDKEQKLALAAACAVLEQLGSDCGEK